MQESIFEQMVQKTASQHSRTPTLPPDRSIQAIKKYFEINRMLRKITFGIVLALSVIKGV